MQKKTFKSVRLAITRNMKVSFYKRLWFLRSNKLFSTRRTFLVEIFTFNVIPFYQVPMQHTLPLYKLAGFKAFLFRDYKMLTI